MRTLKDEAVTQLIQAKLNADLRTGGQPIDVYAADGEVHLVGCCDTEEQRLTAVMMAKGTYGVRVVVDRIQVRKLSHAM